MAKFAIIGLGNPGSSYQDTRHNVGFWLLDNFAKCNHFSLKYDPKHNAEISRCLYGKHDLILVKPMNFMNNSGETLLPIMKTFGFSESQVLVLHDDLTLHLGSLKISVAKGCGGHNGVKSLMDSIGNQIIRIRIGIGAKNIPEQTLANYVLSKFSSAEQMTLKNRSDRFLSSIKSILDQGIEASMNLFNQEKLQK